MQLLRQQRDLRLIYLEPSFKQKETRRLEQEVEYIIQDALNVANEMLL